MLHLNILLCNVFITGIYAWVQSIACTGQPNLKQRRRKSNVKRQRKTSWSFDKHVINTQNTLQHKRKNKLTNSYCFILNYVYRSVCGTQLKCMQITDYGYGSRLSWISWMMAHTGHTMWPNGQLWYCVQPSGYYSHRNSSHIHAILLRLEQSANILKFILTKAVHV